MRFKFRREDQARQSFHQCSKKRVQKCDISTGILLFLLFIKRCEPWKWMFDDPMAMRIPRIQAPKHRVICWGEIPLHKPKAEHMDHSVGTSSYCNSIIYSASSKLFVGRNNPSCVWQRLPRDQGHPNPRHGLHAQHPQHMDVGVATTHQDQIFDDWRPGRSGKERQNHLKWWVCITLELWTCWKLWEVDHGSWPSYEISINIHDPLLLLRGILKPHWNMTMRHQNQCLLM